MRWFSFFLFAYSFLFSIEKPVVFVSVSAYSGLVQKLVDGAIDVETLVPPGVSFHYFEPKPQLVEKLTHAKLWFTIGDPFEERIKKSLQDLESGPIIVDLQKCIDVINHDPHIWTSPRLFQKQLSVIYTQLQKVFPKIIKETSYQALNAQIDELIRKVDSLLDNQKGLIVVAHNAYAYLCREYSLQQLSLEEGGKEPTLARLQSLVTTAKNHGVKTVFALTTFSRKGIERVAQLLNAQIIELDPFSPQYIENTLHTAQLFRKALDQERILQ